jgi:hypothetical protein
MIRVVGSLRDIILSSHRVRYRNPSDAGFPASNEGSRRPSPSCESSAHRPSGGPPEPAMGIRRPEPLASPAGTDCPAGFPLRSEEGRRAPHAGERCARSDRKGYWEGGAPLVPAHPRRQTHRTTDAAEPYRPQTAHCTRTQGSPRRGAASWHGGTEARGLRAGAAQGGARRLPLAAGIRHRGLDPARGPGRGERDRLWSCSRF